jgi:hypothetical protein
MFMSTVFFSQSEQLVTDIYILMKPIEFQLASHFETAAVRLWIGNIWPPLPAVMLIQTLN